MQVCRALRPPDAASLSASGRRCCCSWSEPPRRPTTLPGSADEGDGRPTARPRAVAVAAVDRRDRRPSRNAAPPDRRPSRRWRSPRQSLATAADAAWERAGKAPPGTALRSSAGYAAPAPCSRQRLEPTRVNHFCRGEINARIERRKFLIIGSPRELSRKLEIVIYGRKRLSVINDLASHSRYESLSAIALYLYAVDSRVCGTWRVDFGTRLALAPRWDQAVGSALPSWTRRDSASRRRVFRALPVVR